VTDTNIRARTDAYIHARYQHPAWQVLATRRAPLVISCLQSLFEESEDGIAFEEALHTLAELLAHHANHPDFDVSGEEYPILARRELREWIKRSLVVEREGRLYATDALEEALRFVNALGGRLMTSTASRLSVVQREIESVETHLNPDPKSRAAHIRRKIKELERDLEEAEKGHVNVPSEQHGMERIREIYGLAVSLRADFRRVEDSWREADRTLRHSIVSEQHHRGQIVDTLLDGHDSLLETPEGRVFHGFHEQLRREIELQDMRERLKTILKHPFAAKALTGRQQQELRGLVSRLVKESAAVIQARARIERDVKGFLKTGLASEHHRVGAILSEILQEALNIDWNSAALRDSASPLPPIAFATSNLPLVERLRFKSLDLTEPQALELGQSDVNLSEVDDEFWQALDGLDRHALIEATLTLLRESDRPMSVGELTECLPPTHDLETLTVWLTMAREGGIEVTEAREQIDVLTRDGLLLRFDVPEMKLDRHALDGIEWEI
jgi:Protein of unknown function (DUF3375)